MIKRTIAITSPAKLSLRDRQLLISRYNEHGQKVLKTVPIEDMGTLILEHPQISLTHGLIAALLANNTALVTCDSKYLPTGLMLNLNGNSTQAESFRFQNDASIPLKKQLWQQVVEAKILNQTVLLENTGVRSEVLRTAARSVRSGDADNREGYAASYYWPRIFERYPNFKRDRDGDYPNSLLNYGYSILRAVMARSLVGSGLLPTLGIFHHNRYNHYCLADDMMEPYRPYIDQMVIGMTGDDFDEPGSLTSEQRAFLLTIPTITVNISGKNRPLMIAASETSASLARCFSGEQRKLALPKMIAD